MKKMLAILMAFLMISALFVSISMFASAADNYLSPVATTYVDHDDKTKNRTGRFTTRKRGGDETTPGGGTDSSRRGKTTKQYNTNEGKDDPNSPNYTGNRVPSSDKSPHSPDTASSTKNIAAVAVAVVVCATVAGVASVKGKKSEENE